MLLAQIITSVSPVAIIAREKINKPKDFK
ncbi:hypothetical protein [Dryocola clanedunensis]